MMRVQRRCCGSGWRNILHKGLYAGPAGEGQMRECNTVKQKGGFCNYEMDRKTD